MKNYSGPFERVRFRKETSNGAGKYYAEAQCWYRDTRCTREHAAPDYRGQGEGSTPEEARSDAMRSALSQCSTDNMGAPR